MLATFADGRVKDVSAQARFSVVDEKGHTQPATTPVPGLVTVEEPGRFRIQAALSTVVTESALTVTAATLKSVAIKGSLWIPSEIASTLSTVHANGIIHRDLKPANIMLVADPVTASGERVRVLDFGIAKLHTDQHPARDASWDASLHGA